MRFYISSILFIALSLCRVDGQKSDAVLFTVDKNPVTVSEFNYIYNKNNGKNADYSKESIEEYLDLYVKFKLKVQKAKELKLDTIKALQDELAGYRQQLAKSYLVDKEVNQKLIDEAFQRKQKDIKVAHILISLSQRTNDAAVGAAMEKARKIKDKLEQGADFSMMAKTMSNDKNTSDNNGELGWLTAMLPSGFYDLENAIYNTPVGKYADPIRSPLGVHLIKILDTRPARGEREVAHLLIRNKLKGKPVKNAKARIDSLHQLIMTGKAEFDDLVVNNSDDANTKKKKGYLGNFGISQFEIAFEDAAFNLENDGDISAPVESAIGWHIIKRIGKKDYADQTKMKAEIQNLLKKNDRAENARLALISNIKRSASFKEFPIALNAFAMKLDESFYSYKWAIPQMKANTIFSLGDQNFTTQDLAEYCKRNTRTRLRFDKKRPVMQAVKEMYSTYTDEKTIQYEEANLEARYPEFKSLMREYEEGILLFEATKINVWDRASQDKEGLNAFYERKKENYTWKQRGIVDIYTLKSTDDKLIDQVLKLMDSEDANLLQQLIDSKDKILMVEEVTQEMGSKEFLGLDWKVGAISKPKKDTRNKITTIKKIKKILPKAQKTMDDARGYIIADYQDELELAWIKELKKQYPIDIKKKVLKSLIKK